MRTSEKRVGLCRMVAGRHAASPIQGGPFSLFFMELPAPALPMERHGLPRFRWKAMPRTSREGASHRHPEFGQILVHVALLGNQTLAQFTSRSLPQLSRTLIVLHRSTEACCRQASLALKLDMQMGTGGSWIGIHWH